MDIKEIKAYCKAGEIQWTAHVMKRLLVRKISREEIKQALLNGEIIEDYPTDYPYPSCLVMGFAGAALHVVCGIGDDRLWIITAYRPDPCVWDASFTKRR